MAEAIGKKAAPAGKAAGAAADPPGKQPERTILSDVTLPITPGWPVTLELSEVKTPLRSTFVGQQEKECIILRLPAMEGAGFRFSDGAGAKMLFLNEGRVYGFQTNIVGKYVKGHLRYLFLTYPRRVETLNVRKHQRVSCLFPSLAKLPELELKGMVLDIAPGGLRFVHHTAGPDQEPPLIPIGEEAVVEVRLPGVEGVQHLVCDVRNLNQDKVRTELGFRFLRQDDAAVRCAQAYVEEVLSFLESNAPW
ncbi:MAG: flagellar brake protein [Deltaproteobacteria bacterium]|nr:flagellar brake protein [Deltaproteobacteria bacterium]